jgi:PBP1b-binding outer membrane lipoprotein LpoB
MKTPRKLMILSIAMFLLSCGGGKSGDKIEQEAKESADKAADESFEELNRKSPGDSVRADSSTVPDTTRG